MKLPPGCSEQSSELHLRNDVLPDAWRPVDDEEVEVARHDTQRILEDFYNDKQTVENILTAKGKP